MSASDSRDLFALLMTLYFGDGKDEYGQDVVPPIPLFFDRVNEGRPPTSDALLFQLPFEILHEITLYLAESSLAALSLVSKDCCQLARSLRFNSVLLNYSESQSYLIKKLSEEVSERSLNIGSTVSPSIGACFRRLQIATDARWASYRLKIDLFELNNIDGEGKKERIQEAHSLFFGNYIPAIELILARALPHLELLDIRDHIPLPRSFFNTLALSSIQHLKLCRVTLSEEFEIALPEALAHRGWPLRTLHLELHWRGFGERGSTAPLCASILNLCAPTLEKLTWVSLIGRQDNLHSLVRQEPPHFLSLRELKLSKVEFSDYSSLKLLVSPQPESRLKVLETDADNDSSIVQSLESCGTIRSLETFVWNIICLTPNQSLAFLSQNSQLLKLRVSCSQPPALIDERILPIISRSFRELKSLSLTWNGTSISNSALELIGTLYSLEQLHLSTGKQFGWRHDWFIRHSDIRGYLRKLHNLKKLAFTRDTYETRSGLEEDYYSFRIPIFEELPEDFEDVDDLDLRKRSSQICERQHRRRILKEADDYVRALPRLEWMYCGQIPMSFIDAGEPLRRQAVVLSQTRDDCSTLLRRMFGRG